MGEPWGGIHAGRVETRTPPCLLELTWRNLISDELKYFPNIWDADRIQNLPSLPARCVPSRDITGFLKARELTPTERRGDAQRSGMPTASELRAASRERLHNLKLLNTTLR